MTIPNQSKIIQRTASKVLTEYNIVQKGQSRIWLDDQYWYTTIIEFQPLKGRQGTCLNIGANFHWYKKEHLSFDLGYRESNFIDYLNKEQFESEMENLVHFAMNKTISIRNDLNSIEAATNTIINHKFASDKLWGNYHRAVICGLNNDQNSFVRFIDLLLENDTTSGWEMKLKERANSVKGAFEKSNFKELINSIIKNTRLKKKLFTRKINYVW